MKSLSTVIGATIIFQFHAHASPTLEDPFYCGKRIIPYAAVKSTRINACISLGDSDWLNEFPAALDGSKIFNIKDATLFSWPLDWISKTERAEGDATSVRVVIDSMCRLIGVLNIVGDSYLKCIQPLNPQAISTQSLELSLGNPIKNYGIGCNEYLFLHDDLQRARESLNRYHLTFKTLGNLHPQNGLLQSHTLLSGGEKVWSWPIEFIAEEFSPKISPKTMFRVVLDSTGKSRGLIQSHGGDWSWCQDIQFIDTKPTKSLNKHKNSVGENYYNVNGDVLCGDQTITAITINSHMQAACIRVQALLKSGGTRKLRYPWSPPNVEYQSKPIWYWPIRLPEIYGQKLSRMHQLIFLTSNCEYLGIFYFLGAQKMECQKLQAPLLSLGLQTEAATSESHPTGRYFQFLT
ncbi:putative candidate secreted effector protein [Blumeria hordei DH14]|uniref:Putative candidate secreted effector protein n=1 Tax=Blumeria graminis f. sp. hordei (strain DH14) TaxID=546991 RepID=N1JDB2_BLUG1|nr:putative candidate secreted effector protein [Blumeria hordei DH14]